MEVQFVKFTRINQALRHQQRHLFKTTEESLNVVEFEKINEDNAKEGASPIRAHWLKLELKRVREVREGTFVVPVEGMVCVAEEEEIASQGGETEVKAPPSVSVSISVSARVPKGIRKFCVTDRVFISRQSNQFSCLVRALKEDRVIVLLGHRCMFVVNNATAICLRTQRGKPSADSYPLSEEGEEEEGEGGEDNYIDIDDAEPQDHANSSSSSSSSSALTLDGPPPPTTTTLDRPALSEEISSVISTTPTNPVSNPLPIVSPTNGSINEQPLLQNEQGHHEREPQTNEDEQRYLDGFRAEYSEQHRETLGTPLNVSMESVNENNEGGEANASHSSTTESNVSPSDGVQGEGEGDKMEEDLVQEEPSVTGSTTEAITPFNEESGDRSENNSALEQHPQTSGGVSWTEASVRDLARVVMEELDKNREEQRANELRAKLEDKKREIETLRKREDSTRDSLIKMVDALNTSKKQEYNRKKGVSQQTIVERSINANNNVFFGFEVYSFENLRAMMVVHTCMYDGMPYKSFRDIPDPLGYRNNAEFMTTYCKLWEPGSKMALLCYKTGCIKGDCKSTVFDKEFERDYLLGERAFIMEKEENREKVRMAFLLRCGIIIV